MSNIKILSSMINNYKKTDFNEHHIKVYFKISDFHEREKRISFYIFVQTWQEWYKAGENPVKESRLKFLGTQCLLGCDYHCRVKRASERTP